MQTELIAYTAPRLTGNRAGKPPLNTVFVDVVKYANMRGGS